MTRHKLPMNLQMPWGLLTTILLLLCLVLACGWWWSATKMSRGNSRRGQVALQGESAAERLLEREGFVILDRQVTHRSTMLVDGEPREISVRLDLLVEKSGMPYIAEVKTGKLAPTPTKPETRRQLREYGAMFPDHGLLLIDAETLTIYEIDFPD